MESSKSLLSSDYPSQDYKSKMSELPKRSVLAANGSVEVYQYQGFWHLPHRLETLMCAQDHFVAQQNDILIASYPKTGTTWLKSLAFAITTRNQLGVSSNTLEIEGPHRLVPSMELSMAQNQSHHYFREKSPFIATHVPYSPLPNSILTSECKIVYIWRDPTDAFISMWHFMPKLPCFKETEFIPIEEAFQQFCDGYTYYGPYSDHILSYWRAYLERPGKILFLKYEDLKINTRSNVKKLAEFMSYPFSIEEEKEGVIDRVIDMCSFKHLSNLEVNKTGIYQLNHSVSVKNDIFFRKAEVGDWKNYLSVQLKQQMDQIMELKFKDSGLTLGNPSSDAHNS